MNYLISPSNPTPNPTPNPTRDQVTLNTLKRKKQENEKITMLTCYDACFASLLDKCELDILLVDDSVGMVFQGHSLTLPVRIEELVYHTQCVARGNRHAFILADLPFGTFYTPEIAYENAVKLIQAGAHAVKIEGGNWLFDTIHFLTQRSIPVCAHLGLMPQSVHLMGGYRLQGNTVYSGNRLKKDAIRAQSAGAVMLLLEVIPASLAQEITQSLDIPTIGIGAGPACSGQVLVLNDMLGIVSGIQPRFVRNFMPGLSSIEEAVKAFVQAVREGSFPTDAHSYLGSAHLSGLLKE